MTAGMKRQAAKQPAHVGKPITTLIADNHAVLVDSLQALSSRCATLPSSGAPSTPSTR